MRDGDDYVITGTKVWITNAGITDLYTVFAKTDPAAGHRGITAFLVEADWGVQVTKLEQKLGVHGSPTGQVLFDEVRVPVDAPASASEGRGLLHARCTRSTAAARPSGPRPSASRRARSTTPSGT